MKSGVLHPSGVRRSSAEFWKTGAECKRYQPSFPLQMGPTISISRE